MPIESMKLLCKVGELQNQLTHPYFPTHTQRICLTCTLLVAKLGGAFVAKWKGLLQLNEIAHFVVK